jgi:ABC-type multidrug transport system ATPase subunit
MRGDGYMIKAEGLTRRFGSVEAVHNLSFHVESGSVYGLLGKNGSGKTTAIRLLLGLLWPNAGQSWVLGEDSLHLSPPCRQRIGYVSESGLPYDTLPMPALVRFVRGWFPQLDWRHTNELLQRFVVPTDRPLKQMSRGERRLCELILELAKQPDVLILDDPAVGLDVTVRREFLGATLDMAREEGKAVFFTSHVLSDVERVVDTVGILERGRLLVQASLEDLKTRTKRLIFTRSGADTVVPPVVEGEICRTEKGRDVVIVTGAYTPELEAHLRKTTGLIIVEGMNLDEIFIALTEHQVQMIPEVGT